MADQLVRGIGHHGLWGLSPAFDFVEAIYSGTIIYPAARPSSSTGCHSSQPLQEEEQPINILLVHPGDIRHILYTISRRKRHYPRRPIHFYLLEPSLEILSRDLLLLEVSIDFEIPIRQRANIFLEIFGNALVQERTARYIEQLGQKLISLAVNSTATLQLVDLHLLKYKDRDGLEEVFKSYNRKFSTCDMVSLRDHRLRGYYAERYDSRRALGDWDWQYSFRETAASIIHITLYRDWREKGIAFEFGDQSYVEGNRTMMTFVEGTMKRGKDIGHHKEVPPFLLSPPSLTLPLLTFPPLRSRDSGPISSALPFSPLGSRRTRGLLLSLPKPQSIQLDSSRFSIRSPPPPPSFTASLLQGTGTEQHRHHTVEVAVYNMFSMLWEMEVGEPYSLSRKNDIFSGLGERDGGRPQVQPQVPLVEAEGQKKAPGEQEEEEFVRVEEILDSIEEETETEAATGDADKPYGTAGQQPPPAPAPQEKEEELLAQELKRAECIVETFRDVKVSPAPALSLPSPSHFLPSRSSLWSGRLRKLSRRHSMPLSSTESLSPLAPLSSSELLWQIRFSAPLPPPLPPRLLHRVWWRWRLASTSRS
jgi:hypothetical protein